MDQFQRTGHRHQSRRGVPTASAAAMARIGRTRFPPAMRLYRMLSWSVVGAVVAAGHDGIEETINVDPLLFEIVLDVHGDKLRVPRQALDRRGA